MSWSNGDVAPWHGLMTQDLSEWCHLGCLDGIRGKKGALQELETSETSLIMSIIVDLSISECFCFFFQIYFFVWIFLWIFLWMSSPFRPVLRWSFRDPGQGAVLGAAGSIYPGGESWGAGELELDPQRVAQLVAKKQNIYIYIYIIAVISYHIISYDICEGYINICIYNIYVMCICIYICIYISIYIYRYIYICIYIYRYIYVYIYHMLQNVPWIYRAWEISHQAHLCLGNRDDAIGDCDQVQWRDMSWREETRSLLEGCQDNPRQFRTYTHTTQSSSYLHS